MRNKVAQKYIALFLLVFFIPLVAEAQSSRTETIAAVVNDDAVSESDVIDRMKLIIASSGMSDSKEMRERMRPRIINVLIDEKLKIQEADRLEFEITEQEIENGFAAIAARNKFSADQFRAVLKKEGVSPKTLEDQIRSEIAWSRVVQLKIRPQITIADNEVDTVIERMKANIGKKEYRVSEIFLPVEKPADEADVSKLANKITRQLVDQRVPFQRMASQFSQAAGATKGGDMGWVTEGNLPEPLDAMLSKMKKGELSNPVRSLSGFHILYLRDIRSVTAENVPGRDQVMNDLGMQRLDRMQKSYLLDLKTAAFIERRV
jgi:peptidyl-prolyl cis-trans isomerase SurA